MSHFSLSIRIWTIVAIGFSASHALAQTPPNPRAVMDEVEPVIKELETQVAKLKPDGTGVNHDELRILHVRGASAIQSMQSITQSIQQRALVTRYNSMMARLTTAHTKITETLNFLQAEVLRKQGMGEQAFQPVALDLDTDADRVNVLAGMFDPELLKTNPHAAAIAAGQIDAAKVELRRIGENYAPALGSPDEKIQKLRVGLSGLDQNLPRFEQSLRTFIQTAPRDIDADINEAIRLAANVEAIADRSVEMKLESARAKSNLFLAAAPNSPQASTSKTKVDNAEKRVAQMIATKVDAIAPLIQPVDAFQQADRSQIIEAITAAWKTSGDSKEVLKVGISSDNWERRTLWEWKNSTWTKSDVSKMEGFVIVKLDDRFAEMHCAEIVKDHRAEDRIEATLSGESSRMSIANVK